MKLKTEGLIAWFTRNPVAANLVMIFIFCGGAISLLTMSKEMFPRSELNLISVTASYPGAAPVEVEKGVVLPMEAALEGLQGIKKITSAASRDFARMYLEIEPNEDLTEVRSRIENRIDGITNLPEDLEQPQIKKVDQNLWALGVSVYGPMTQRQKKVIGEEIYDDLLALPAVKEVQLWGAGTYEISIEVDEDRLRALNLTLNEVASAVRQSSLDMPAGMIRTNAGNLLVRTEGKPYRGDDFSAIVLRSGADGTQLLLGDVADVRDGFTDSIWKNRFDRQDAITLGIFSLKGQNLLSISEQVHAYVEQKQKTIQGDLKLSVFNDEAYYLNGRLSMMSQNLLMGGLLVALVLGMFLNIKVALWVIVGIPVSFAGAFWLMPFGDVTINILSLFAFIMVLGIVVDDAIVIGESVYSEVKQDYREKLAAGELTEGRYRATAETVVRGAQRVATPSTIGVLTTMAAFFPIMFVGGSFDGFTRAISIVVILCLTFSLIESKLILPSHLVGLKFGETKSAWLARFNHYQGKVSNGLESFVEGVYKPLLKRALRERYTTLAAFVSMFILILGAVNSGIARFEFFPTVPGDNVQAEIIMQDGASAQSLTETIDKVESAIYAVNDRYLLENPKSSGLVEHVGFFISSDVEASFRVVLTKAEDRAISAIEVEKLWRAEVGLLPSVRKQRYFSTDGPSGAAISLSLSGSDSDELSLAGIELQQYLGQFPGVFDTYNSQGSGSKEVLVKLKPHASQVGVRLSDIAGQVRSAFYGEEAQRIQRDSDTIKVMVRYPAKQRQAISTLENMHIRTANGEAVAIGEVAELSLGTGLTAIERLDRKRTVTLTAEIDVEKVQSGEVIEDVRKNFIPQLTAKYPSVEFRLSGGSQEQREYYVKLGVGLLAALFMIYGLLAVPLRSYIQPLVIMSVIPFGFIGAVIGHVLFDMSVNMLSIFGIIALAGVVVNDSLILVEFANRGREANQTIEQSILNAGQKRFRAILLTTLTTFVGLLPLLFETSLQAQFVIPMAISLSFGILFASTITLLLIPCLYLVVETNQRLIKAILTAILLISIVVLLAAMGIFSFVIAGVIASVLVLGAIGLIVMRMMGYFPEKAI